MYVAAVPEHERVDVCDAPRTILVGLKVQVSPAGDTVEVNATVPVNALTGPTVIVEVAVAQVVGMVRRRHPRRVGIPVQQIERRRRLALEVVVDDIGPDQVVGAQHVEGHRHPAAFEHA